MAKCNQWNCKGEFISLINEYGEYWKCSVCGHIIDKRCNVCGEIRTLTIWNGSSSVAKCTNCGKQKY